MSPFAHSTARTKGRVRKYRFQSGGPRPEFVWFTFYKLQIASCWCYSSHPKFFSLTLGSCKTTKYRLRQGGKYIDNVVTTVACAGHRVLYKGDLVNMDVSYRKNYADKLLDLHLANWSLHWQEILHVWNERLGHIAALSGVNQILVAICLHRLSAIRKVCRVPPFTQMGWTCISLESSWVPQFRTSCKQFRSKNVFFIVDNKKIWKLCGRCWPPLVGISFERVHLFLPALAVIFCRYFIVLFTFRSFLRPVPNAARLFLAYRLDSTRLYILRFADGILTFMICYVCRVRKLVFSSWQGFAIGSNWFALESGHTIIASEAKPLRLWRPQLERFAGFCPVMLDKNAWVACWSHVGPNENMWMQNLLVSRHRKSSIWTIGDSNTRMLKL